MGLESLRLLSAIPMAELDDIWSTAEILYFDSYKDTVVLELVDCDVTEEDKAVFKRIQNLLGRVLSVSMKRHTPNDL
ncbi:hypothetical protein KCU81_g6939, partial [Aureobasidium melanogenum]